MLTLNDTPLNDNQARFVVKIEPDTPIYLSNYIDGITLSGVLYDGEPLIKNSLQDNGKSIDISNGGGIGNVQAFQLQIARYQTNTELNEFFNDLFPATGKQYLIARPISIGFCWEGATTAGEITWFFYGYIDEYSYNADTITLLCLEYAELENIELPYYKVQKEFNNQISYTTELDEPDYGMPLPIIFGNFTTTNFKFSDVSLAPTVLFNKNNLTYKVASHKCKKIVYDNWKHDATARYYFFRLLGQKVGYMAVYSAQTTGANNNAGHYLKIMDTAAIVYGYAEIQLNGLAGQSETASIANTTNIVSTDYSELEENKKIALRVADSMNTSNTGVLGSQAADIVIYWDVASSDGTNRDVDIYHYNNETATGNTALNQIITTRTEFGQSFGNVVTAKSNSNLPFTIEELINYEYVLRNNEVVAGKDVYIYNAYLVLFNILVSGTLKSKPFGFSYMRLRWGFRR